MGNIRQAMQHQLGLVALVLGLTAICSQAAEASKPKHLIRSTIRAVDCAGPICIGGGCCPEPSWVCCPHGKYCAINLEACPKYDMVAKVHRPFEQLLGRARWELVATVMVSNVLA